MRLIACAQSGKTRCPACQRNFGPCCCPALTRFMRVFPQFRKEEELSREVLAENRVMIRQVWENGVDTACKVLPLAADTRSTYSGQMKRLEQLAMADRDTEWNVPASRSDLRWHAMIRLYNAFCRHVALPRFKLSASLPRPMALYLRSLVRGSTEEEREGVDFLDDWLNEGSEPAEMFAAGGVDWEAVRCGLCERFAGEFRGF
jgi:hypothetical protein